MRTRAKSTAGADGVFELFVNANRVVFQGAAGITVSSNLPFRRRRLIPEDAPSTVSDWMRAAWLRVQPA